MDRECEPCWGTTTKNGEYIIRRRQGGGDLQGDIVPTLLAIVSRRCWFFWLNTHTYKLFNYCDPHTHVQFFFSLMLLLIVFYLYIFDICLYIAICYLFLNLFEYMVWKYYYLLFILPHFLRVSDVIVFLSVFCFFFWTVDSREIKKQ